MQHEGGAKNGNEWGASNGVYALSGYAAKVLGRGAAARECCDTCRRSRSDALASGRRGEGAVMRTRGRSEARLRPLGAATCLAAGCTRLNERPAVNRRQPSVNTYQYSMLLQVLLAKNMSNYASDRLHQHTLRIRTAHIRGTARTHLAIHSRLGVGLPLSSPHRGEYTAPVPTLPMSLRVLRVPHPRRRVSSTSTQCARRIHSREAPGGFKRYVTI